MGFFDSRKKKKQKKEEQMRKQREEALSNIKKGDFRQLKEYGYDKEIVLEAINHSKEDISSEIALFLQRDDIDVVRALMDRGWMKRWDFYGEQIQTDPTFLKMYIEKGGNIKEIQIDPNFLLDNKEFALLSFRLPNIPSETRKKIVEKYNDDYQIGLEAVGLWGEYFELLSSRLQQEYGIIKTAIQTCPNIILKVDRMFMKDSRIVEALLKSILQKRKGEEKSPSANNVLSLEDVISILNFIGDFTNNLEIRQSKREVLAHIIASCPTAISQFDESIQNDPLLLMTYLQSGGLVNRSVLKLLKVQTLNENKDLALEFVKSAGQSVFEDLNAVLQNNLQIAREAVKADPSCIRFVTNKETLKILLKENKSLRRFVDPKVFEEVLAGIYEDEKEGLQVEAQKNAEIEECQQRELRELKNAIANERLYQQTMQGSEEQRKRIAAQQKEIEFLKKQLALLKGETVLESDLEKGENQDEGKRK